MKKALPFLVATVFTLTPFVVLAQATTGQGLGDVSDIFDSFIRFINDTLIPLVFALALLMFFYGIFKYFILGGGDEGSRQEGRQLMLYAIIGFVVMASIYGIVEIISAGLGINQGTTINVPEAPTRSGGGGGAPDSIYGVPR